MSESLVNCFQVYKDIESGPEEKEFSTILTLKEMHEQVMEANPKLVYFKLPIQADRAPEEKVIAGNVKHEP